MLGGYLFGAGAVLLFWIVSTVVSGGTLKPWALAVTHSEVEGRQQTKLSASKLQAIVWTMVTLFAYGSVFGALFLGSKPGEAITPLPNIPINLLVLMGLSVATAAGAKGVTVSYKDQGRIGEEGGGLVTNAQNQPDLVKAQMLVWTFVAAGYYLLRVVTIIKSGKDIQLPDVDGALLVLMGTSQGAYIGDKLVSRDITKTPKLNEIKKSSGPVGTEITLVGENFGANQEDNFVELDDGIVRDDFEWGNLQIKKVSIPTEYKAGDKIGIRVYRDGEYSEKLFFTVTEEPTDSDPNA